MRRFLPILILCLGGAVVPARAAIAAVAIPTRPAELTASPSLLPGTIDVSWRPPSDGSGSPVLRYRLCRGTSPGLMTDCSTTVELSAVQSGLPILTTHYFSVTAINAVGESPATEVVCAKAGPWVSALGC